MQVFAVLLAVVLAADAFRFETVKDSRRNREEVEHRPFDELRRFEDHMNVNRMDRDMNRRDERDSFEVNRMDFDNMDRMNRDFDRMDFDLVRIVDRCERIVREYIERLDHELNRDDIRMMIDECIRYVREEMMNRHLTREDMIMVVERCINRIRHFNMIRCEREDTRFCMDELNRICVEYIREKFNRFGREDRLINVVEEVVENHMNMNRRDDSVDFTRMERMNRDFNRIDFDRMDRDMVRIIDRIMTRCERIVREYMDRMDHEMNRDDIRMMIDECIRYVREEMMNHHLCRDDMIMVIERCINRIRHFFMIRCEREDTRVCMDELDRICIDRIREEYHRLGREDRLINVVGDLHRDLMIDERTDVRREMNLIREIADRRNYNMDDIRMMERMDRELIDNVIRMVRVELRRMNIHMDRMELVHFISRVCRGVEMTNLKDMNEEDIMIRIRDICRRVFFEMYRVEDFERRDSREMERMDMNRDMEMMHSMENREFEHRDMDMNRRMMNRERRMVDREM